MVSASATVAELFSGPPQGYLGAGLQDVGHGLFTLGARVLERKLGCALRVTRDREGGPAQNKEGKSRGKSGCNGQRPLENCQFTAWSSRHFTPTDRCDLVSLGLSFVEIGQRNQLGVSI